VKYFLNKLSSTVGRRQELFTNSDSDVESNNIINKDCPNSTEVKFLCVTYVKTSFTMGSAINFNPHRVLPLDNLTFPHVNVRLSLEGYYNETSSIINMQIINMKNHLVLYHIGPCFSINYILTTCSALRILNMPDLKTFSISRPRRPNFLTRMILCAITCVLSSSITMCTHA